MFAALYRISLLARNFNEICQTVDKRGICQATSTAQRKLPVFQVKFYHMPGSP